MSVEAGLQLSRDRVEQTCYLIGAALISSGLVHLGVFAVRGGPWLGPVSWRKPATFGLSFGISLISVTWVASYLRMSERVRTLLLGSFAVDCILEVAGITVQAWRHVPSHLNTETPFNTVIAMALAFGGAVLIAVLGALAAIALRGSVGAAPSMRLAVQAGFALVLVGLASGAAMIARGEVLMRAGNRQLAYDHAGFSQSTARDHASCRVAVAGTGLVARAPGLARAAPSRCGATGCWRLPRGVGDRACHLPRQDVSGSGMPTGGITG
jgi:hypothetical protein